MAEGKAVVMVMVEDEKQHQLQHLQNHQLLLGQQIT